jgi:hypothetical protein
LTAVLLSFDGGFALFLFRFPSQVHNEMAALRAAAALDAETVLK